MNISPIQFCLIIYTFICFSICAESLYIEPQKKFIELGWDIPDTKYLKENIEEMEMVSPFDGIMFYIRVMSDGKTYDTQHGWDTNQWYRAWFIPAINDLKNTKFKKFTDNFIRFNATPGNIRWDDEEGWKNLCEKAAICAWILKETKQKGIALDFESYGKLQFKFDPSCGLSFKQCSLLARKRGKAFIEAIAKEKPDTMIFTLWLNSINFRAGNCESPDNILQNEHYGLLPAFVDGMLDGISREMVLVDGCESGYYMDSLVEYLKAANNIRSWTGPSIRLVSPENRQKYIAQVQAGFGFYLDMYLNEEGNRYYFPPLDGSRLKRLYRNLFAAHRATDEYVWIYGEQCRWWKKPTTTNWSENLLKTQGKGRMWEDAMPGITRTIARVKNPLMQAKQEIELARAGNNLTNLAVNPDFAIGPKNGGKLPFGFTSWQYEKSITGDFSWDSAVGGGSARAYKVTWGCLIQKHKITPGDLFYVSAQALKKNASSIDLIIRWQGHDGKWTDESRDATFTFKPYTNSWLKAQGVVEVPENAGFLLILLNVKNQTGIEDDCWFDNIELYKIPPIY